MSGMSGRSRRAAAAAARTVACASLRRIGPPGAALHRGKLVAQRGNAALREFRRHRRHERMIHARSGAMRQHIASAGAGRRLQQAGNAKAVFTGNGDGLGMSR